MRQTSKLAVLGVVAAVLFACAGPPIPTEPVEPATATVSPTIVVAEAAGASACPVTEPVCTKPPEDAAVQGPPGYGYYRINEDQSIITRTFSVALPSVAAADFDNDGHADLVSGGEPQLTIWRGNGQGDLAPVATVPGGPEPDDFALADLDEDGDLDIAVANHDTDYLTILLGDGQGAFQPAANSPLHIQVQPHPHVVRAADLDGDGQVDLIVDHRQAGGVLILLGLGAGQFATPGLLVAGGGDPYRGMALGDIDGDGKLDLLTPNPSEAGVLVNTSTEGNIAFTPAPSVPAPAPFAVALGDLNGDGRLDLIAASDEGSALVEVYVGDGRGGFAAHEDSPWRLAAGAKNIAVGDFNGDGMEDAAIASWQYADVLLIWGGRSSLRTDFLPGDKHPWGLVAADFNEDGRDDLVIADGETGVATIYLSLDR